MDVSKLVRENIKMLVPYKSARSEFTGQANIFIDANENPFNSDFNRYPDPYQLDLKRAIGSYRGISAKNIMLGNGSDEIIDILIRIFCRPGKDSIYTFTPGFGMFEVAAGINDVDIYKFSLDEEFVLKTEEFIAQVPEFCKLIFLCSPNNPTGNSISVENIIKILSSVNCMVAVDEAYIDFSDHESVLNLLPQYENLIVLQTFSKAIGGAGLRIGIAFSSEYVISLLHKVKMPYNLSIVNQKVGLARLLEKKKIQDEIFLIKQERKRLERELKKFSFITKIYPSDANFLLVKTTSADILYKEMVDTGIVVRNRSNLFGCHNCLRISIGTPQENDVLLRFLESKQSN